MSARLGAALAACAFLFALPSLYVPGIALLALVAIGAGWTALALRAAHVERPLTGEPVEEGEPVGVVCTASAGRWPLPGGELACGPDAVSFRPGRRPPALRVERRFARRGRHGVGPATLIVRDPLGVNERAIEGPPSDVLVLPRVEPVRAVGGGRAGEGFAATAGQDATAEVDLDALRPYRPGTPASRIHWPTVARRGELVERRLIADAEGAPLVVLDSALAPSEEALDRAVRAAASLAHALSIGRGCRVLLPGDSRPSVIGPALRGWRRLHQRLATVEAGAGSPRVRVSLAGSTVLWVSARPAPPFTVSRRPNGDLVLVTPADARGHGPNAAFTVAGCVGRLIQPTRERAA